MKMENLDLRQIDDREQYLFNLHTISQMIEYIKDRKDIDQLKSLQEGLQLPIIEYLFDGSLAVGLFSGERYWKDVCDKYKLNKTDKTNTQETFDRENYYTLESESYNLAKTLLALYHANDLTIADLSKKLDFFLIDRISQIYDEYPMYKVMSMFERYNKEVKSEKYYWKILERHGFSYKLEEYGMIMI